MNSEIYARLALSRTKENLMKAFAGESQARNRYIFAAASALDKKLYSVGFAFQFTAKQEEAHAKVFFDYLKNIGHENVELSGNYPVDIYEDVLSLLKNAQHNEMQEFENDYAAFEKIAQEEGFTEVAQKFRMIAEIEKTHADRFGCLASLMENGKLFVSDTQVKWMCLNCGHVFEGTQAPQKCPVCSHEQGYFVRLEFAPYTCAQ